MLLNPEPCPESSRILSNIVIGESIKIHHPTSLNYSTLSLSFSYFDIFLHRNQSQNFTFFLPKKGQKKLIFRPEKCQNNPDTQARISRFLIGVLAIVRDSYCMKLNPSQQTVSLFVWKLCYIMINTLLTLIDLSKKSDNLKGLFEVLLLRIC